MPEPKREPIVLKLNRRYPTFQLYAEVSSKRVSPEIAFRICILEIMAWLRKRFAAYNMNMPEELLGPEPDDFKKMQDEAIKSFHIDIGYTVDVLFVPHEQIWSMRLIEPDPGANMSSANPRLPVPGRLFETNLALRLSPENSLHIGCCTKCSEPDSTTEDCEVFRPVAIKNIAQNPLLGLKQEVELLSKARRIETTSDLKKLHKLMTSPERDLPILALLYPLAAKDGQPDNRTPVDLATYKPTINRSPLPDIESILGRIPKCNDSLSYTVDVNPLAESLLAFAHVFVIEDSQRAGFRQYLSSQTVQNGDWVIINPVNDSSFFRTIPCAQIACDPEKGLQSVKEELKLFPKRREVHFRDVLFFTDAKFHEFKDQQQAFSRHNETEVLFHAKLQELADEKRDIQKSADVRYNIEKKRSDLQLSDVTGKLEKSMAECQKQQKSIADKEHMIRFYQQKALDAARFPTTIEQIEKWVRDHFSEYLSLHERAVRELKRAKDTIDPVCLCDGLYFLHAHVRYLRKEISKQERDRHQIDYGWDVCPSGKRAIETHESDYQIKVTAPSGKQVAHFLDQHIKQGCNEQFLIRIYFYWDEEQKKIVIGSLPHHLPTA